eukprot:GHVP01055019.1.p1 GENE.GHVP01055019.1~~GHVP01055019.1.p1  ORF type:complete len:327 (-),score=50.54 GHVP01055019.1:91-1071(-)
MEPTQAPLFPFWTRSDPNELLLQEHLNRAIPYESDHVSAMPKPNNSHTSQRFIPYLLCTNGEVGSEGATASTSDLELRPSKMLNTKEEKFLKSAKSSPKFEATIEPATHMVLKFKDITIKVLRRPTTRKEDRLGYEFFIDGVNGGKSLGKLDYETLRTFHNETFNDVKLQSLWQALMIRLVGSLGFAGDLSYYVHDDKKGISYRRKEDGSRDKICRENLSEGLPEGWDFYFVYPEDHQMKTMEEHIELAEKVVEGPAEVVDKHEKIKYSLSEGSAFPNYEIIVYRILPSQRATVVFGRDFGYPNIFYKLPYLDIEGIMKLLKEKVD